MNTNLITIINKVTPAHENICSEIAELKESFPSCNRQELAEKYAAKLTKMYTSTGVASALPSVIPGMGTAAQIAIEGATVSADLTLMLRWGGSMCYGIGLIYGKDMEKDYNLDLIRILGLWSGVIISAKEASKRVGTKVVAAQFNRHVTGQMLSKVNKKVGVTIFTKYGAKRGGIALGRLIPFGVGAAVGGTFNYRTMKSFSKSAIKHYENEYDGEFVLNE